VVSVAATPYRLVLEGELGPRYSALFEGMHVKSENGETVVIGTIEDQAQLHGLLDRIASLGIKIVSLAPASAEETAALVGPPG
jgi:hypothetical protein